MIKNQKGITLTETLVTMIILGILAGGMISILSINATETSEGNANIQLQMQYENIVRQISFDARHAKYILDIGTGETFMEADTGTSYNTENNSATHIEMFDIDGNAIAGYRINNGILQELDSLGTYSDYFTGNQAVAVTPNSHFRLLGGRKAVQPKTFVTLTYNNTIDTLETNTNYIRCRN